ncbi:MAG: hypothetical protein E6Q88_13040 [Lysobacteraceae bacterium]|nr:MAG: hypothetical protein E6Q88_13040 [Xanthomonadaceae bacterium]
MMFRCVGGLAGAAGRQWPRWGFRRACTLRSSDLTMLKAHRNQLEPRPSDRLRIGERLVDIPLREVGPFDGDGERARITLKALGVLLALVAHAGKPVSREALLEWVWPDTLPTDDVITQAITLLRKALGDDRDHPSYIETIAKQGYRLIAPIEWIIDDDAGAVSPQVGQDIDTSAQTQTHEPLRDAGTLDAKRMAVALVVALAAAFAGYRLWKEPPRADPMPSAMRRSAQIQRITSMPEAEGRPSLSPDGSLLVYSRYSRNDDGASLMAQTTAAVPPRQLTEPAVRQWDLMPAWSPDGREIAFVRIMRARCMIMRMPAVGGDPREIGECIDGHEHPVDWYPDGEALIGARRGGALSEREPEMTLYRMSLQGGRWEPIPYARSKIDEDMSPKVSPDGRWIVFQRHVSLADLWRMPVEGGVPERLTRLRTNIYGMAWTPDSKRLIFAHYYDREGRVILASLDIASGRIMDYAGSTYSMMYPTVARAGDAIAFDIEEGRSVMRRIDIREIDGARDVTHAPVFESTGSNLMPAIAPDGEQIIFMSDRSGDLRLWWAERGKVESLRSFEGFVPIPRYPVVWHAGSRSALAIGHGAEGRGVYEIDTYRGRAKRMPVPGPGDPVHAAYHPDPTRMLVVSDHGQGRLGLTLYDRSREPWRALASIDDAALVVPDPLNARVVFARMVGVELWAADLDLGHASLIDEVSSQRRTRLIAASATGLWVMDGKEDCPWYWRPVAAPDGLVADRPVSEKPISDKPISDKPISGKPAAVRPQVTAWTIENPKRMGRKQVGRCVSREFWAPDGVSYDAAQEAAYWSVAENAGSDIGLLSLRAFDARTPDNAQN